MTYDRAAVAVAAPPPPPDETSPRSHRIARAFAATATLLIAAWGAVTGTLAWLDQREVSLRIAPDAYPAAPGGAPLHLSIANPSRRGVTIFGGELLLEGRRIGSLSATARDTRADWSGVPPRELERLARPLPLSVAADGAFSGTFFWTADRGVPGPLMRRLVAPEDPADPLEATPRIPVDVELAVRLDIEPGDDPQVDVPVVRPRRRRGPSLVTPEYHYGLRRGRVSAVHAQLPRGAPEQVLTLRLWSRASAGPVRVVTRPSGLGSVRFPLGRLPSGSYSWAVQGAGDVSTGEFRTPCDARPVRGSGGVVPVEECFELTFGP